MGITHSLKPWKFGKDRRVSSANGNTIADCRYKNGDNDGPLIAAAPDLLDALLGAQEELRLIRMKDCDRVYDPTLTIKIHLAISKAEGKS